MLAFSRVVGAFIAMMVVGYIAVVVFVPAPAPYNQREADYDSGQTAALRLTTEAQALVSRKPAGTLQ